MKKNTFLVWLLLVAVCLAACKKRSPQQIEAEKIVTEWIGKTIHFPDDVPCIYPLQNSIVNEDCMGSAPFKILLYTDSVGCTSCKLKLFEWKNIISEADSLFPDQVDFLFYFQPKNERELKFLFKRDRFEYPVFIDTQNRINRLNQFPENSNFQCFLLDAGNNVLAIGNPVLNLNIWKLYKQIISGEATAEKEDKETVVSVEKTEIYLENLVLGEETTADFVLKNTGGNPLIIYNIKSACGCTVPVWEKQPIEQGESTGITVKITPEETGYFRKTIEVYCNTKEKVIPLTIQGNVK